MSDNEARLIIIILTAINTLTVGLSTYFIKGWYEKVEKHIKEAEDIIREFRKLQGEFEEARRNIDRLMKAVFE